MIVRLFAAIIAFAGVALTQTPPIEPGVSLELAKWRAARYSDVRYKLNLTLEKMSPVLKGTIEIRVKVSAPPAAAVLSEPPASAGGQSVAPELPPIVLDWRRIKGHEEKSTVANVTVNGQPVQIAANWPPADAGGSDKTAAAYFESNEHLIFREGVVIGENVIKLDFTSPILTSGSAITRYVDKEDGAEYIYSLFVPSDASTAFPVFDQPDLKARFQLTATAPSDWLLVTNDFRLSSVPDSASPVVPEGYRRTAFFETKNPISTYVFAFAGGPFERFTDSERCMNMFAQGATAEVLSNQCRGSNSVHVRKSQAAKFKPHAAEVFRLNREAIKYFESYFDYKFPFPKYDLVLIPEFPFGGMEHAGATFLRESSIIFPQEPTKNDYISRATLIFHEAAHQWFGDTVTMRWFDDLWLKEGFATFTAYKAMENIMPEYNSWKVFYERVKQAAYQTDSTKGTTPIYQEIKNLSAAKSAYGAIVYNKAPAFLRQAEFYLGEEKFQTAVRAFLKKHEYANAGWEDLVRKFEEANGREPLANFDTFSEDQKRRIREYEENLGTNLTRWAQRWVVEPEVFRVQIGKKWPNNNKQLYSYFYETNNEGKYVCRAMKFSVFIRYAKQKSMVRDVRTACDPLLYDPAEIYFEGISGIELDPQQEFGEPLLIFPNYKDYGYGIFLLDPKSRDYVLKNIGSEKDDFLRTMMWGALWDSVREAEMDPREYVELVVKNIKLETDESTIQTLLSRVSTAMRYYIDAGVASWSEPPALAGGQKRPPARVGKNLTASPSKVRGAATNWPPANAGGSDSRLEALLIDRMQNAPTPGQKITYYRAFLNLASSENARRIMKEILNASAARGSVPPAVAGGLARPSSNSKITNPRQQPPATAGGSDKSSTDGTTPRMASSTKDRFDIVTRLIILGDPEAGKLLAELERTETSDDAKRYAYAARAGFATAENKAKFWNDFVNNKEISESWIEAAFGPFNNIRHSELTLPYLERALKELPNHKRNRKIFFVNGWLGAFIGGQRSDEALAIINKFLADNPNLDRDLRLKILENADIIERAVKIRAKY